MYFTVKKGEGSPETEGKEDESLPVHQHLLREEGRESVPIFN